MLYLVPFLHLLPFCIQTSSADKASLHCVDQNCHSRAKCKENKCTCNNGFKGDGVMCTGKQLSILAINGILVILTQKEENYAPLTSTRP